MAYENECHIIYILWGTDRENKQNYDYYVQPENIKTKIFNETWWLFIYNSVCVRVIHHASLKHKQCTA